MLFRVDRAWLAGVPGGGDVRRKYVERYSSSKNCFGGSVCFKFWLYNRDCQIIEIQVIQDINSEIISAQRLSTVTVNNPSRLRLVSNSMIWKFTNKLTEGHIGPNFDTILIHPVRSCMIQNGLLWSLRVSYGPPWSQMVSYGPVCSRMVPFGPIWYCMVSYHPVLSRMSPNEPI